MHTATFSELRNKAANYFDEVENGESIIITRHNRPIAKIIPFKKTAKKMPSYLKEALMLEIKGVSASKMILEDRGKA
jgi:prevent-host-death family protein